MNTNSKQTGDNNASQESVRQSVEGIGEQSHQETKAYYQRLKWRLQVGLLIAYMVPLVIISFYFHFQFNLTLKESGKLSLIALAESQRNTIDLFLQERVVNIFNLFLSSHFKLSPSQDDMQRYLRQLRKISDAFVDVGFLDSTGVQVGYAGPYEKLFRKDYSREHWFQTLLNQHYDYYISDIYLGFRQVPHFTIGVKQLLDGNCYVMRATLDPDKFYIFLRTIGRGKDYDAVLVNREGRYQVVDPSRGNLLATCSYVPDNIGELGAREIAIDAESCLVAYAQLREVPWTLIIRRPLKVAYSKMYLARHVIIGASALSTLLVISVVILTTNRILRRAQNMEEARTELKSQLFHASKLVSVGELAGGVAHEINNPLAIIQTESGLIRDMLDPQFGIECTPQEIRKELDILDGAVLRARDVTQKLLNLVRKSEPRLTPCNINQLLLDVVSGLMEKEFQVNNIKLIQDFDQEVPEILADPDQIRQVFLNLINNAGDAIEGGGTISLTTRHKGEFVYTTITDNGRGMTSEEIEKIFIPFFTTKEVGKGTGLGLSISMSIVEAMGGRMQVQSLPGAGSSFTVVLPSEKGKEKSDE